MRRLLIIVGGALLVALVVAGLTMWTLYRSATASVSEYEALLEIDAFEADAAAARMESQLAALWSDTQTLPEWSTRLTAEEINGWFATKLQQLWPSDSSGVDQPRTIITNEDVTVMTRARVGTVDGVITVTAKPYVTDQNELALEVTMAKLGRMQLPAEQLGAYLRQSPLAEVKSIRFTRGANELVVILDPGRIDVGEGRQLRFTGIDLREGEILVRGESVGPQVESSEAD